MKYIHHYLTSLLCIFALLTSASCKDNEESLVQKTFEISNSELSKELDSRSATLTVPVKTDLRMSQWSVNSSQKWVNAFQQEDKIILSILNNQDKQKRNAKITIESELANYAIELTQYGVNDIATKDDIKFTVTSGRDNQHEPNAGIELSFDDDINTQYHSPWAYNAARPNAPTTEFPVILEYFINGNTEEIDRIVYRSSGGNGTIGAFALYYSEVDTPTSDANYQKIGDYDFKMSGTEHVLDLPEPIRAKAFKFVVSSGSGDNNHPDQAKKGGFVSCLDMGFYQKSNYRDMNDPLLNVFTDLTCTTLREGVTEEDINNLPSETFKRVALALKNNTYDEWEKNFRIRNYEAYSDVEYWADKIQTKKYSNLDNPTGIYVSKDEEVVVLVGDTHGKTVTLQTIWEVNKTPDLDKPTDYYKETAVSGDIYPLVEGVNLLKMKGPGQLFVMYTVPGEGLTEHPEPIKIHIPLGHGVVNGFFDLKEHKTDAKYAELIGKATHKYFCVRGERMTFYFHRLKMLDAAPDQILSAINLWDDIVGWEQSLMGISSLREEGKINNHMLSISPEGAYMWASDYRMGFVYTYLRNILLKENVMAVEDNAWGPAHEMGHVHQYAINWPMSTESSNNLFSNYVIRRLGKYKSRGRGLASLANAIYRDKQAWWNMGSSTHQNEDTETHMRMNWQLWIYYDLCKGNENESKFWPKVFEIMRTKYKNLPGNKPKQNPLENAAERQMAFAKAVSEAAQEDLTDFFETWGFFKVVNNEKVDQYGEYAYNVTEQMIADTKAFIQQYPKKAAPIQYIEDRRISDFTSGDYRYKEVGNVGYYTQFMNNEKITKHPTYTMSASVTGSDIKIKDGEQAVAFEVRKKNADDSYSVVTYFSNFFEFTVPRNITLTRTGIYAVQADGERIEVTKAQ